MTGRIHELEEENRSLRKTVEERDASIKQLDREKEALRKACDAEVGVCVRVCACACLSCICAHVWWWGACGGVGVGLPGCGGPGGARGCSGLDRCHSNSERVQGTHTVRYSNTVSVPCRLLHAALQVLSYQRKMEDMQMDFTQMLRETLDKMHDKLARAQGLM